MRIKTAHMSDVSNESVNIVEPLVCEDHISKDVNVSEALNMETESEVFSFDSYLE